MNLTVRKLFFLLWRYFLQATTKLIFPYKEKKSNAFQVIYKITNLSMRLVFLHVVRRLYCKETHLPVLGLFPQKKTIPCCLFLSAVPQWLLHQEVPEGLPHCGQHLPGDPQVQQVEGRIRRQIHQQRRSGHQEEHRVQESHGASKQRLLWAVIDPCYLVDLLLSYPSTKEHALFTAKLTVRCSYVLIGSIVRVSSSTPSRSHP